jgi:single-stranded-DNA-specific exonuclease
MDISGIVFTIGPRINASGRIAHAAAAVNLLMSKTDDEAFVLAESINVKNEVRKQFDTDITEEAIAMIESNEANKHAKTTVLYKDSWHKGVIGIVASRCIERYYRPTVILTSSNDKITGSARSVHGFNLYNAIADCGDLLEKFGGHMYAAGLTLHPNNLVPFQQKFESVVSASITSEMLTPVIHVDAAIDFDAITQKFVNILVQMAPFGPGNQRPVFTSDHVCAYRYLSLVKEKHIRFIAQQKGSDRTFACIGFNMESFYEEIQNQRPFRMAYTIEENEYNDKKTIQLVIKDIKFE